MPGCVGGIQRGVDVRLRGQPLATGLQQLLEAEQAHKRRQGCALRRRAALCGTGWWEDAVEPLALGLAIDNGKHRWKGGVGREAQHREQVRMSVVVVRWMRGEDDTVHAAAEAAAAAAAAAARLQQQ